MGKTPATVLLVNGMTTKAKAVQPRPTFAEPTDPATPVEPMSDSKILRTILMQSDKLTGIPLLPSLKTTNRPKKITLSLSLSLSRARRGGLSPLGLDHVCPYWIYLQGQGALPPGSHPQVVPEWQAPV